MLAGKPDAFQVVVSCVAPAYPAPSNRVPSVFTPDQKVPPEISILSPIE